MSYLARDGLYLRGIPGSNSVEFAAPGGAPNRLRIGFIPTSQKNCKNLCPGSSYYIIVEVGKDLYYLNATGSNLYLSSQKSNSVLFSPLQLIDDPNTFQMFPAELNGQTSQFMIEPQGTLPIPSQKASNNYFLFLFLLIGALSVAKLVHN